MNLKNKSIIFGKLRTKRFTPFKMEAIEGKNAGKTLRKGCEVLKTLGLHYWISAGTLLGLHRDNAFIKHDTDLDVGIIGDENNREIQEKIIKTLPFRLIQTVESGHYMQLAFMGDDNIIFDIYIYYQVGNAYLNWNPDGILHFPTSLLDNLTTLSFDGYDYPCPNPDIYCEHRYGPNWRTPKKFKGAWRKDTTNLIQNNEWLKKTKLYLKIWNF